MSAAKKITIPYLEEKSGYLITAKDSNTAKTLEANGYKMRYREGMFCLKVEELPKISGVQFRKHKLKVPSLEDRKDLETEYEKYIAMEQALDLMMEQVDAQREKLSKKVDKIGLRLKPSLPKDAQIYLRGKGIRLHNCTSVTRTYDEEGIKKASKKYPVLERCFDIKRITLDFGELSEKDKKTLFRIAKSQEIEFSDKFDKAAYNDIESVLPPAMKKKLVTLESYQNFRETELPNADCIHCGRQVRKDGTCKGCNLSQTLE